MRSKKKLSLLLAVMLLGSITISGSIVQAEDAAIENNVQAEQSSDDKVIKGNKQLFEEAQNSIDKKEYQDAINYLTTYINSKPKRYEAYKLRGECYYELRQYKLAQEDFETAIKIKAADDKFVTGAKVVGAMVLGADKQEQYQNPELGNLYGLLMYAQKAQNNPAYEGSFQEAGRYNSHIYLPKPNKNDIAKINCPQKYGKKINQTGINTYIYDAISDIEKGDFHEAVFKIQHITSDYPKFYLGHYLTGVAYVGLEQEKEAVSAFEAALKLNSNDFESLASLGQIYYIDAEKSFAKEDVEKSVSYFKKALALNPNCYLYHYYIGLNHLQINDYNSALDSFNSAIKLKSDDYNSRYYKAIALYMIGDYAGVVEESTKLLFRHVSNYNSVLYLRALANYKMGMIPESIADVEKIENNMNDIYNADVRVKSAKEKTLGQYLHYLKAQISRYSGFGAVADLNNAFQNPLIKDLDKLESNNSVGGNVQISFEEIGTQYDYIRTTFSDLNLQIASVDSGYLLVPQQISLIPVENKVSENAKSDLLLAEGETSIAKMLASNDFDSMKKIAPAVPSFEPKAEPAKEEIQEETVPEVIAELPKAEQVADLKNVDAESLKEEDAPVLRQAESSVIIETKEAPVLENETANTTFTISYPKEVEVVTEPAPESEKVVQEVKQPDFVITYPKEEVVVEKTEDVKIPESDSKISEKHAVVDMTEFSLNKTSAPEIKDTDEVIEFNPESFIFKAEKTVAQAPFNITVPNEKPKSEDLTVEEVESEVVAAKVDEVPIVESIVNSEEQQEDKIVIKTVDETVVSTEKNDDLQESLGDVETTSENPMLQRIMVPSIVVPEKTLKKEVEEVVAEKSSSWVEPNVDSNSIVVDDKELVEKKLQDAVEEKLEQEKLAQVKETVEKALELTEASQELPTEPKIKHKKAKKQKSKTKKLKPQVQVVETEVLEVPVDTKSLDEVEVKNLEKVEDSAIKSEEKADEKSEAEIAVESVVQTLFNGKSDEVVEPQEEVVLEEVEQEKPVKVKKEKVRKSWFKRGKLENVEPVEQEVTVEDIVVPQEAVEESVQADLTPAVTYINPEKEKKERKVFFKKGLFKHHKSENTETVKDAQVEEVSEVEPPASIEETPEVPVKVEKLKKEKNAKTKKEKAVKQPKQQKTEKVKKESADSADVKSEKQKFSFKNFFKGFFVDVNKSEDDKVSERKVIKQIEK